MSNVVFTLNEHHGNTHINDFTMISDVFTMNYHQGNTHTFDFAMNSNVLFNELSFISQASLVCPAVCWLSLGVSSGPPWISLFCMAVSNYLKTLFYKNGFADFAFRRRGLLGTSGASRHLCTNTIDCQMISVDL